MARIREEGARTEEPDSTPDTSEKVTSLEQRLEDLAEDMAGVIEAGDPADQESLHDYAVSLVRERLPVAADHARTVGAANASGTGATAAEGGSGVHSVGLGFLLVPVGFLLAWIFPPVGLLLMVAGTLMVCWGLIAAMIGKVRGESDASGSDA